MSSEISNEMVLQAITKLTEKVEEYHGDFREFRGNTAVRIEGLEQAAKDAKFWNNVKVVCVLPTVTVLHQIAVHFGWIK